MTTDAGELLFSYLICNPFLFILKFGLRVYTVKTLKNKTKQ